MNRDCKTNRTVLGRAQIASAIRTGCTALISWLFLLGGTALPVAAQDMTSSSLAPEDIEGVGIEQKLDENIPLDLVFVDEQGRDVVLGEFFGKKPVVLSLVYYECPMLCTLILNGLLTGLDELDFDIGEEFEVVTVSFNPNDTPKLATAKKRTYVERYGRAGAADGWHFLTGSEESIKQLTDAVGFKYKYDAERKEYIHASGIMVATPAGKLSRYFYGIDYAARDIKLGLMDASEEKIGSIADQILLFCYHYDPTTGKYGVAIMNIMRVIGGLTVLGIVVFIVSSLRREKQVASQAKPV